ncbi:D-2-hydroxyacid dehydrogenase family protein [Fodinicurvata sp. EGI_FJ10296]|uniref:D-2-hydroxyacid dehydrogenase family protein n=1 Tax=Fodinicurvata sp. EGI_FJ10296 TaxID=3231908 RepID=UPI00345720B3
MPKIAILDDYLNAARDLADWSRLGDDCEITVFNEPITDEAALVKALEPFDIVCLMRERTALPGSVIRRLDNLDLIMTAGRRNAVIDLAAAAEQGVMVCGTESSGRGTIELTWSLILNLFHRIRQNHDAMRQGQWQTELGSLVQHKTLGIVGLGRLGGQVAQIAAAFDMTVIAWSQNLTDERAAECGATRVDKETLFRQADVISIHQTLSNRTRGLVDAATLGLMKPTAYFVNTSRGPIVDTAALVEALSAGRIAGAAVDVYDEEPLPADHPLRRTERLLMTPHIGYVSTENMGLFYRQMVDGIEAWRAGKPIRVLSADKPAIG